MRASSRSKTKFGARFGSLLGGSTRAFSGDPEGLHSIAVSRDYRHSIHSIKTLLESNPTVDLYEISFSCKNLPKMDIMSDSDPFLVVYLADGVKQEVELLRTETIWDENNPSFVRALIVSDAASRTLRVTVYDRDQPSEKLESHDFLGESKIKLSECYNTSSNGTKSVIVEDLKSKKGDTKSGAKLEVGIERVGKIDDLQFPIEFHLMLAKGIETDNDIFFVISRQVSPSHWTSIYRSEVKGGKSSISAFQIASLNLLCCSMGDLGTKLRVELYRYKAKGNHPSYGSFVTSIQELEYLSTNANAVREFLGSEDDLVQRVELTGGFLADDKMSFTFEIFLRGSA